MSEPRAQSRPRLVEIRNVAEEHLVRLMWSDGHSAEYAYDYVRGWCPCALCQGHGNEKHFVRAVDPQLRSIEMVGNYALQFTWSDGHDTGIYSFQYLREICPCEQCRVSSDA